MHTLYRLYTLYYTHYTIHYIHTIHYTDWVTSNDSQLGQLSATKHIQRAAGDNQFGGLYKPEDIQRVMGYKAYEQLTFCVDPYFEMVCSPVRMCTHTHSVTAPCTCGSADTWDKCAFHPTIRSSTCSTHTLTIYGRNGVWPCNRRPNERMNIHRMTSRVIVIIIG